MYFAHPIEFFALPILKKIKKINKNKKKTIRIYQVWFLFRVIPGVDSYLRHLGTVNK